MPGIIHTRAQYRAAARRLRNTGLDSIVKHIYFGDDASALHSKGTGFETIHGDFASNYKAFHANGRK